MNQTHRDDQEARGQSLLDEEEFRRSKQATCRHCERGIELDGDRWVDPNATGDDDVWRETCAAHDTFAAEHEPEDDVPGVVGHLSDEACDRLLVYVTGRTLRESPVLDITICGFTVDQAEQVANAMLAECEIARRTEAGEFDSDGTFTEDDQGNWSEVT